MNNICIYNFKSPLIGTFYVSRITKIDYIGHGTEVTLCELGLSLAG